MEKELTLPSIDSYWMYAHSRLLLCEKWMRNRQSLKWKQNVRCPFGKNWGRVQYRRILDVNYSVYTFLRKPLAIEFCSYFIAGFKIICVWRLLQENIGQWTMFRKTLKSIGTMCVFIRRPMLLFANDFLNYTRNRTMYLIVQVRLPKSISVHI